MTVDTQKRKKWKLKAAGQNWKVKSKSKKGKMKKEKEKSDILLSVWFMVTLVNGDTQKSTLKIKVPG